MALTKLLFALLLFAGPLFAQTEPATVIVVRHAEKLSEPANDPALSAEGWARAEALVEAVRHAGITTIFSTPYTRTRDTAGPVAKALGLTIIETPIPGRSVDAYARDIAARVKKTGGVLLVVGHSNTMGAVIRALGGPNVDPITDAEYSNLFVLTVQDGKPARMVRGTFGPVVEAVVK